MEEVKGFIQQVYLPDVIAVGALYKDWLPYGAGVTNYLAVPDMVLDTKATSFDLPGGTIMGGDLATVKPITSFNDPYFKDNVVESIARSWYDGDWTKHPYEEETVPEVHRFPGRWQVHLAEGPAFPGRTHAGRPPGPGAGRLRPGS